MDMWILIVVTLLISASLVGVFRTYAIRSALVDTPGTRSSHTVVTPTGGGAVMVVVFVFAMAWLWLGGRLSTDAFMGVAGGASMVAGVGFLDDRRHLSPIWRLAVHGVAVFWLLGWQGFEAPVEHDGGMWAADTWWFRALVVVGLVWLINLYNFMDGIDGLAGGEAVSVALGASLILWSNGEMGLVPVLLCLAAAVGGFLIWNWPPARIFMGDVGSGFLGFALGAMAVLTILERGVTFWSWVILLGVFIVDATLTLLIRITRAQRWYEAHRSHAYQHAARRWGRHRPVTAGILSINLLWLWPIAWYASNKQELGAILTMIALGPLVVGAFVFRAGMPDKAHNINGLP